MTIIFIIKHLAEELKGDFECLEQNTEITLSVSMEKQENGKTIKYKIIFIGSARFMARSLSNLTDNLAEVLHKGKCKDCKSSLKNMS